MRILPSLLAGSVLAAAIAGVALAQDPAEKWKVVGMKGGAMGWETLSLTTDIAANTASLTRFTYFAAPKPFGDDAYSFLLQDIAFTCSDHTFQLGEAYIMDATGKVLGESKPETVWRAVKASTPEAILESVACRGASVVGSRDYDSFEAAVIGAAENALP